MAGLAEIASIILSQSMHSVEISAQNITNISTPGYKRRVAFSQLLAGSDPTADQVTTTSSATDFSPGKIIDTGNPLDLAVSGEGFLALRSATQHMVYVRSGQFSRDGEGRLVTQTGLVLQTAGGGDLVLKSQDFKLAPDGAVLEDGQPVARLEVMAFASLSDATRADGGAFSAGSGAMIPIAHATVRQGAIETSNVSTGDEMVGIMAALRQAEAGKQLINVYDDLIGRAITTFGQL